MGKIKIIESLFDDVQKIYLQDGIDTGEYYVLLKLKGKKYEVSDSFYPDLTKTSKKVNKKIKSMYSVR